MYGYPVPLGIGPPHVMPTDILTSPQSNPFAAPLAHHMYSANNPNHALNVTSDLGYAPIYPYPMPSSVPPLGPIILPTTPLGQWPPSMPMPLQQPSISNNLSNHITFNSYPTVGYSEGDMFGYPMPYNMQVPIPMPYSIGNQSSIHDYEQQQQQQVNTLESKSSHQNNNDVNSVFTGDNIDTSTLDYSSINRSSSLIPETENQSHNDNQKDSSD